VEMTDLILLILAGVLFALMFGLVRGLGKL
jgi:hypothetical protein